MVKNIDSSGLKSVASEYDLFFIDLWGVIHNGILLFESSINVLKELEKKHKEFVLLTNAPRPNLNVVEFLLKIGMDKKFSLKTYTSGEAALEYLSLNFSEKKFFHLGPERDFDLFNDFKKNKSKDIIEAEYILCTGLFEKNENDLIFYKKLLKNHISKIMICTNPDLIVDRGEKREFCAGSLAKIFEEIGGKVQYFGKPYPNVYNQATNLKNKKVLCIGDNLNTDIKGANSLNFDSLLITNGIHKEEIKKSNIENIFEKYNVKANYSQTNLKW
tara:strand:+ start:306 stop:1124 length:819 start_codon:yes stop_codon:yes gene_type:complete